VRAEELGYSSLWVNDYLLTPRIEALTMLAAVAPLTSRVTLGTAALLPVLRRPVQAAQTLASIDALSGGRLVLTVGAAFPGRFGLPQHALSDVPWERRFTRLDETVALWRQLWADPEKGGSFHGSLLRFEELPPMTAPSRPGGPPVWLGAASEPALRRTGRNYDGWMPYLTSADSYADGLAAVRAAAAGAGRSSPRSPRPATGCRWSNWSRFRPWRRDPGRRRGETAWVRGGRSPSPGRADRHHQPGDPARTAGAHHQAEGIPALIGRAGSWTADFAG
jgi:alkanesulfonate monooxygenase SsuD/methylene tetrahydromethanopterin reductase-like flavin-dependent oxidoreductase (luciferase family)